MKNNNKEKDDRLNPNNKVFNPPKYKIHGSERRVLKKEHSFLKSFVKSFWSDHYMDRDMSSFYGGSVMGDEDAKVMYDKKVLELEEMDKELSLPYLPIFREERLKKLLDE